MANSWVNHVKAFAADNGMTYPQALKCPQCKSSYKNVGGSIVKSVGKYISDGASGAYKYAKKNAIPILGAVGSAAAAAALAHHYKDGGPRPGIPEAIVQSTYNGKPLIPGRVGRSNELVFMPMPSGGRLRRKNLKLMDSYSL